MIGFARSLVLINALLFASSSAWAGLDPTKAITQYTQDLWGTDAGLNNNSVTAIAQTRDGYLWLGTEEGLARFDGVRFTIFSTQNTPSIRSNQISALLADSQGGLWIGTDGGGLTRLKDGKFTTYTTRDALSNDVILSLYEDKKGVLWVGTNGGGLCRFQNGVLTKYTSARGLPDAAVFSISGGDDGTLWVGTHAGLAHLINEKFAVYTKRDGLADDYVKCVHLGRHGDLWIGTNGGGLSHLVDGRFVNYTTRDGLSSNSIWSIYEDRDGSLWVGTIDAGLTRFHDGRFSSYTSKDGLPVNRVLTILEDKEANLWIGTGGAGLVRLKNGSFTSFTTREGLSDDTVLPVYEDRQGTIWLGTNGGGLNALKNGRVTKYTTQNGLSDNIVFSIAEDDRGRLWVATRKGLDRFEGGKFTVFTTANGLPSNIVLSLYKDHEGILWAGSRGGLSRFDGQRFKTYTTADGLSNNYVTSVYENQRKKLWIGTGGGGLNSFSNGHFSFYSTKDGLSSDAIESLSGDPDGTLWIGTSGGGLDRFKDGKFTAYTSRVGILDDQLFQVLSDRNGYLWMSSNKGISRVPKWQLQEYAEGRRSSITSTSYGTSDGLKNKECNGGFQPAGWQTKDGRLLFPTMKGLVIVDPDDLKRNQPPPKVIVERAAIDGKSFGLDKPIEAKPGKGQLEFEFTALSLVASDKIHFKYKLEGFDKEWVDAGQRRVAFYTNISPGEYRFAVTACNNDGVWNPAGASIPLRLEPHFYETRLFISFCIALLGAMSFGIYRIRINRLIANEKRLVLLVNDRTQALQAEVQEKERARSELAAAQQHLMELSRRSGMAEVATGVLHNVGNVLNSVNVGATVIADKLRESRTENLTAAVNLLQEHAGHLSTFVETDPKGQRVLPYLAKLSSHFQGERRQLLNEVESLTAHIDHIKEIVATQQDYAKGSVLTEVISIPKLVDDAVKLVQASFERHHLEVLREIEDVPDVTAARHKVLEILVNLLRNAKHAVIEHSGPLRQVRICAKRHSGDRVRIEVHDTGTGIPAENLVRIFAHGFTTKRNGHGFGLHSGALAARQMQGSLWAESGGPGWGATFILELPVGESATRQELTAA
ncbi:MAG TPA: two-component regulator propeller domain-containing protein [Bryobacteraceae bacterium]|jgi:ligand-binding sensor domain-containing protein/signal transduction histidine kinase|nr:two-component regulator propeller domain-containing protein [Bryobacteraceae bacterium]